MLDIIVGILGVATLVVLVGTWVYIGWDMTR
jgi:hypothetical protein